MISLEEAHTLSSRLMRASRMRCQAMEAASMMQALEQAQNIGRASGSQEELTISGLAFSDSWERILHPSSPRDTAVAPPPLT
jgi:hypothetical protein